MIEKADALNNQAILLAADGSFKEAIACFKRAITIQQDNYLLWYNLGVTYRDKGDFDNAYDSLKMAYKISPDNEDAAEAFATLCLAQNKHNETWEICTRFLRTNPYSPHFWNLLGVVNFQQEDYGTASEFFEQAVYLNPYYLDALYNLRDTYSVLNIKDGELECQMKIDEIEK